MATVSDSLQKVIQEVFVPKVDAFKNELSPTHQMIKRSAKEPYRDKIGRDWKVVWPFRLGLAGAVEFSSVAGPNIATDPSTPAPPGFQLYQDLETWPGIDETTVPGFAQRTITLKKMKIQMLFPLQIARAGQLEANVADQVEHTIEGTAQNVAMQECGAWWSKSQSTGSLTGIVATVLGSATTISSAGTTLTVDGTALTSGEVGSSIRRIEAGARYDLYRKSDAVKMNIAPVFADVVDGNDASTEGTIKLYTYGPAITIAAVDYVLIPRNSSGVVPTSLEDTIKSSGSIFGVPIASYPHIKSVIRDVNGAIDENTLLKYTAKYNHSKGGMFAMDSLVAGEGVWSKLYSHFMFTAPSTNVPNIRFERNGSMVKLDNMGIAEEVSFMLFGRKLRCIVDSWAPAKTMYGLKLNNNWQVVRPPRVPGTGTHPAFDSAVEFVALWATQGRSIFLPFYQVGGGNAGAFTNMQQAPAEMWYEYLCQTPCGMKLTRLTENFD